MNVAETALTAHPGIKVIACVNDQMALGAWQAVQNLGLYADDFYIGGGDNTSQIASYIADEACAIRQSVDIDPPGSGYTACQMAYDILMEGAEGYNHFFEFNPNWQPGVMD
jgi:ribose transport system substrate-binding protein